MTQNENPSLFKPRHKFVSLQTKLVIGFTVIFSIVFASTYYWFYDFAQREAMDQIKEGLYDTIKGATETGILGKDDNVQVINGDELQGLIQEGQVRADGLTDDPRYWHQVTTLCDIRRVEPRASLYTYIKGKASNEVIFITSWGACLPNPDWDQFAKFRTPYESDNLGPNLAGFDNIVFQTDTGWCSYTDGANCTPQIYGDKYGSWVSAFGPIKNSKGETIAALGVDFTSTYVRQVQQQILNRIFLAFSITYIILLSLVYFVSKGLTRPMSELTRAAEQIGDGNYETGLEYLNAIKISEKYPDEIETMQRVFHGMVDKVYKREHTLRKEVETLRIQIDESKRRKQVDEIVESEFFQSLTEKAQQFRKRHKEE